jgi:fructokinase|tara:strand:+ start:426 stop:1379 length:954 start_codon:yes stop_codon:yes gene_type:complete
MSKQSAMVIGDANVDLVIKMPNPNENKKLEKSINEPTLYGGGSAANVAVAISRLDCPVMFCGTVGDDGYGEFVRNDLVKEGVDTKELYTISNSYTPMVIATIQPNGERQIVVWPPDRDADLKLQLSHINKKLIENSGWFHTSGMCLRASPIRETILESMRIAKKAGVPISLDLNLRLELWGWEDNIRSTTESAIELADYIFGNATEEIIPISKEQDVEKAIFAISKGKKIVVAREGHKGSTAIVDKEVIRTSSYPTKVLDTLGAGDAFSGGFIAAKLKEKTTKEALEWGNAVASLKIKKSGARGTPSLEEVNDLLSK